MRIVDLISRSALAFSSLKFLPESSLFEIGDFDAYEIFIHTVQYVSELGTTYGKQIFGALLFWLPRSLWVNKPIGSGAFIASYLSQYFNVENFNVSNLLISEFFINFHILGVILGSILYGIITGWLDKAYFYLTKYRLSQNSEKIEFYSKLYPFLLGLYLFNLRGDFMSSFAYAIGFSLAFITILGIIKLKIR
jgi:hypothetical protein